MANDIELPKLPEFPFGPASYTLRNEMREYARAAVLADREKRTEGDELTIAYMAGYSAGKSAALPAQAVAPVDEPELEPETLEEILEYERNRNPWVLPGQDAEAIASRLKRGYVNARAKGMNAEDALMAGVRLIQLCAEPPLAAPQPAAQPMTAEDIERQYKNGVHVGSGLPRETCPCGFCQKYRTVAEPQPSGNAGELADNCRAAFEAWFRSENEDLDPDSLRRSGDGYAWIGTDEDWIVWCAALAAQPSGQADHIRDAAKMVEAQSEDDARDAADHEPIEIPEISNYYGGLRLKRERGIDYWSIENYDGDNWYRCAPAVANAIRAALAQQDGVTQHD